MSKDLVYIHQYSYRVKRMTSKSPFPEEQNKDKIWPNYPV